MAQDGQRTATQQARRGAFASHSSTRPGSVGAREVLGLAISGSSPRADVKALLLGARIDTRKLSRFAEPETLKLTGIGAAFVFRYGVLVLFGAPAELESELVAELMEHVIEPAFSPELETASIEIRDDGEESVSANGHIRLREATPERLLLTATVLARSVVPARDESRTAEVFDRIEALVNGLREEGRAKLPIKRVMQHIGAVLARGTAWSFGRKSAKNRTCCGSIPSSIAFTVVSKPSSSWATGRALSSASSRQSAMRPTCCSTL
jgi:hypothetical protein